MNVDAYEFGYITVDGKTYTMDVVIMPDRVADSWWRKEGHRLHIDDLAEAIAAKPEVLVIGTGYYGRMIVPEETRSHLEAKGIRVLAAQTREAVKEFYKLQRQAAKVVAALHLTC
jgi:hypothetical protein